MSNLNVGLGLALVAQNAWGAWEIGAIAVQPCYNLYDGSVCQAAMSSNGAYNGNFCVNSQYSNCRYLAKAYINGYGTPYAVCFCDANTAAGIAALSNTVPLQYSGFSVGSYFQITNTGYYECMMTQTNPCADVGWTTYATGVEYKATGRSCPTSGTDSACVGGTTTYRCAAGYYGYSSSGVPTCKSCATTGFSNATSVAGNNNLIEDCYLPVGKYSDTEGTFDITGTYCYLDSEYTDHAVLACSNLIEQGCKEPALSHECAMDYNKASAGTVVCVDCSALDTDGMKMFNRCLKD